MVVVIVGGRDVSGNGICGVGIVVMVVVMVEVARWW